MAECPHINECKQYVSEDDFNALCLGKEPEIEWDQEDCFKYNDIGPLKKQGFKTPKEWEKEK